MYREPSLTFLKCTIALLLAGSAAVLTAISIFVPDQTLRALGAGSTCLLALVAWFLLVRGRIKTTVYLLAIGMWSIVSGVALFTGGLLGTSSLLYPQIILFLGWFIGIRAALAGALLTIATAFGFALAESWELLPLAFPTPAAIRWIIQSFVFASSVVLIFYLMRSYQSRLNALNELESDLNRAQAVARVGSWVYDLAANTMHLSPETCRIYRVATGTVDSYEAYLGRVHPQDRSAVENAWRAACEGRKPFEIEHRIIVGKAIAWPRAVADLELSAKGKLMRAVGTSQDITERKQAEAALRESEARNRVVTESAHDAIITTDSAGNFVGWNHGAETIFGYSESEVIGRPLTLLIPERYHNGHLAGMNRISSGGEHRVIGKTVELNGLRKNGSEFPLELSLAHWVSTDGWFVTGIIRDITERKQAAANLRLNEERLRLAMKAAQLGWFDLNVQTGQVTVSPEYAKMIGYEPTEFSTDLKVWTDGLHPEDREAVLAVFKECLATGNPGQMEYRRLTQSGEWKWISSIGKVVEFDSAGKPMRMTGTHADISERKLVEQSLRQSESRFSTVFHASPIAVNISLLKDGRMVDINPAFTRMFGYTREEALGRTTMELGIWVNPNERAKFVAMLKESRALSHFETQGRTKSGETRTVLLYTELIEFEQQDSILTLTLDVTDRKRIEEAQKLESLGTLAGGIAHDFNNILAAIRGNVDLAAEDVGPDHSAAQSLEEIKKASTRAHELVRRIMAFGRPKQAQPAVVDLGTVVDEVLKLLRSTLPAGISLKTDFGKDTPRVLADASQVHEAVVNLTTNAAHAIGAHGSIQYRLESAQADEKLAHSISGLSPGRYVRLTVTDSGCGMDAATVERIFDAFYTTKPVGEGTGLGLSMVHGTMRSHGGAVAVQSSPGKGSSFALYFPATEMKDQTEAPGAPEQSLLSSTMRVLYVDDEEALVSLARRVVLRLGHSVTGFTDPRQALEAFRAHPQEFDIVVTDLSMPEMSGLVLASEMLAIRPEMPVLMTSGNIGEKEQANALAVGIRELLLKPVSMDELGKVLNRLFRDSERNDNPSA